MNYNKMLVDSAFDGILDNVVFALDNNADVNCKDEYSMTALMCAAWNDNKEIAEILIQAGADIDIKNKDGWTALDCAICEDNYDTAKLIKSHIEKQTEQQNQHAFDLII